MVEIEKFEKSIKTFCQNLGIKMKKYFFCLVQFWRPCRADHFAPLTFGWGHLESGLISWSLNDHYDHFDVNPYSQCKPMWMVRPMSPSWWMVDLIREVTYLSLRACIDLGSIPASGLLWHCDNPSSQAVPGGHHLPPAGPSCLVLQPQKFSNT